MNRLIIVGAGGHGKIIADLAIKLGYSRIFFLDDHVCTAWLNFPVVGKTDEITSYNDGNTDFVIGIGNNEVRKRVAECFRVNWITLVHPSAQLAVDVILGAGTVVMAGAVINANAQIGKHSIINSCAVVEHDNVIGDYVHISPNASIGGTVSVGAMTHIGIGATVINGINICENCIIGAGAVVINNIEDAGTYVGVPVRKL